MEEFIIKDGVLEKYHGKKKSPIIPDGVKVIGEIAFSNHNSLKMIVIPDSVTEIGGGAFHYCRGLQSITLGNSLTTIGDCAFRYCRNLPGIQLPDGVTSIGAEAFEHCANLQSVTIPESITSIGYNAFRGCENIRECVLIPASQDEAQCKMIAHAFGIKNLAYAFLTGNIKTNPILEKMLREKITAKAFRTSYIPNLIQKEETELFLTLLSLVKKMSPEEIDTYLDLSVEKGLVEMTNRLIEYRRKLYPPEKIEEMREIEFEKSIGIREKTLSDYRKDFKISRQNDVYFITGYKSANPIVDIPGELLGLPVRLGLGAFDHCEHIQTVYIDEGIPYLNGWVFRDCIHLQKVTIPDSVTIIYGNAFEHCISLQTITLPKNVISIKDFAFYRCEALESITIPASVTEIGAWAFSGCTSLQSITIPASVTEIGYSAFGDCKNLTVYAPKGSYAEAYAMKNNIKFQEI